MTGHQLNTRLDSEHIESAALSLLLDQQLLGLGAGH
jgi:hypothetical protein